ncbi:MAG TPA: hypothetical protein VD993_03760 [Chitinophagaceae bacterium]|nr:hypothetical protein [Chitinophagaceae bacterium]
MKAFVFLLLMACSLSPCAQQQTYDLITFTPPAGWKKGDLKNVISFSTTNNTTRAWAQIGIIKSTTSKGSVEADFESEWKELIIKPYQQFGVSEQPLGIDTQTFNGWKLWTGLGKFVFNNDTATVLLNTFSNGQRCASFTLMSNTTAYGTTLDEFVASISLPTANAQVENTTTNVTTTASTPGLFQFSTTNFDDGWTSVAKEDWVETTKGNTKVFIHYPKEGTIFPADPEPLTTAAWNILVAPRYSNLRNYKTAYISTYNRPYLGMGTATEIASGKEVFIVLYRQGQTGWLEFVTDDKNSFIREFKFDPETIQWDSETDLLKPLEKMVNYNKFAIAESDLTGTWTSDFTGVQQLYNVYTGNYAGMNIHQSNEEFVFNANNSYEWNLLVVSGMVGNSKFDQVKSSGKFSVLNNWQLHFSKIESGAKTYHAHWSCIKGARLLHLLDAKSPGSGMYKVYGKR